MSESSAGQLESASRTRLPEAKATNTNTEAGMLRASEYKSRRSETLLRNPDAVLNEHNEIRNYFDSQPREYTDEINRIAQLDRPMNPNCRVVVTIPAYNEGTRIKNTLEQHITQDLPDDVYEIVLFANPAEGDTTSEQVADFQRKHPNISIIYVSQPWKESEPATVGNGRKYAADIALARILQRGAVEKDTILVVNDADTVALESNYLSSMVSELDNNPHQDVVTTRLTLPQSSMSKPNVGAAFSLMENMDEVFATGKVGDEKIPEPAITHGRSFGVRSSMYAAVGGFNPKAIIAEDWEFGWMIADARDWNPDRIRLSEDIVLTTDPRRFIDCVVNRVPVDQQLLDFETKPELRELNNEQVLEQIPDVFDWELFQDDADSEWAANNTGSSRRISKRRYSLMFKSAMDKLGIAYEITEDNRVKITNVDKLLERMKVTYGKDISVVHSTSRVYTQEMINQLGNFFNTTQGVVEARRAKAQQIATQITSAQTNGNQDALPSLLKDYERFAGEDYKQAA